MGPVHHAQVADLSRGSAARRCSPSSGGGSQRLFQKPVHTVEPAPGPGAHDRDVVLSDEDLQFLFRIRTFHSVSEATISQCITAADEHVFHVGDAVRANHKTMPGGLGEEVGELLDGILLAFDRRFRHDD